MGRRRVGRTSEETQTGGGGVRRSGKEGGREEVRREEGEKVGGGRRVRGCGGGWGVEGVDFDVTKDPWNDAASHTAMVSCICVVFTFIFATQSLIFFNNFCR